jgi:type IV secretion system protein VirB8
VKSAADAYFAEAASWDSDRLATLGQSRRVAWRVAVAGWICALSCSAALAMLMPLKRVDPFVIRVDSSSGVVDVVPALAGAVSPDEAITRFFLGHYITACERYIAATAESDYEECGAFHGAQRNQAWAALWQRSNPDSPLNLHRDGSQISAQVQSISFFRRGNGVTDLAQVRYVKALRQSGEAPARMSHWIATIQYVYAAPSQDPKLRAWNPLGFKVLEFATEAEIAVGSPASSGGQSRDAQP